MTWPVMKPAASEHKNAQIPAMSSPVPNRPTGTALVRISLGGNLLARLDLVSIAGGVAFIMLLLGGGGFLALRLARLRGEGARTHHPRF